jgi:hypothetical protein
MTPRRADQQKGPRSRCARQRNCALPCSARGESHRSKKDVPVPSIGDGQVARALRHLADQLLETATEGIEALTGEDALIQSS